MFRDFQLDCRLYAPDMTLNASKATRVNLRDDLGFLVRKKAGVEIEDLT